MPLLKGVDPDVLVAVGDVTAIPTSSNLLSGFGVSAAVLQAQGIVSLNSDPNPVVNAGAIFDHDPGDIFTVLDVVDTVDGQVLAETTVTDVAGTLFPVTTGDLASDTAQSAEEIADATVVPDAVGAGFSSSDSGVSLTSADTAQGAIDNIPIGTIVSDVAWDDGLQMYVTVLFFWTGESFVALS